MTDFETWLNQCPYNWLRTGLDKDFGTVTYMFYFPDEEEDEDDEA